ncbi:hypothetical protein DM01DRAFT_1385311 [Hesseltinella vesiculosa]|uniref:PHD-type domain-containing protein n=1 Tax=Hesseltinella vesiculosa TaxID=101127 RepID=A0A1X2GAQ1_9FUNG|nr:hypothetical protein DM01DRAFT_1385311 [Hesseltinella vesiculosa]
MVEKKKKKKTPAKPVKKTQPAKKKKEDPVYCLCRKGYDGKEFMIACDQCQEWFHGRCVGIAPKSTQKHYFCDTCQAKNLASTESTKAKGSRKTKKKKGTVSAVTSLPTPASPPVPTITLDVDDTKVTLIDDEDEDLDDICPICEFECTCGTTEPVKIDPTPSAPPTPPPAVQVNDDTPLSNTIEDDEDVNILDDDDGLLIDPVDSDIEPIIRHGSSSESDDDDEDDDDDDRLSYPSSAVLSEEEDDDDIELEEERAIIADVLEQGDLSMSEESGLHEYYVEEDEDDDDSLLLDDDDALAYIEEDDDLMEEPDEDDDHYNQMLHSANWDTSSDEEDEYDYQAMIFHDPPDNNELDEDIGLPLSQSLSLDVLAATQPSHDTLFNSIAEAFVQVLAPLATHPDVSLLDVSVPNTMSSAPTSPVHDHHRQLPLPDFGFLRRPSLPSNAVLAAHRDTDLSPDSLLSSVISSATTQHDDHSPSPLSTTSNVTSAAAAVPPLPTTSSAPSSSAASSSTSAASATAPVDLASLLPPDIKIPEQLLELIKSSLAAPPPTAPTTTSSAPTSPTSPTSPLFSLPPPAPLIPPINTRPAASTGPSPLSNQVFPTKLDVPKKRSSLTTDTVSIKRKRDDQDDSDLDDHEDVLVGMDDLLDTSQLATRDDETGLEVDDRFSRDLSRWERVPIGAFRMMRAKNRLWLNR